MSKFHISHEPVEKFGHPFCSKCGGFGSSILSRHNCEALSQATSELRFKFNESHTHVGFDGQTARCLECHGRNGELKRYSCQQIAAAALPAAADPEFRSKLLWMRYRGNSTEYAKNKRDEKILDTGFKIAFGVIALMFAALIPLLIYEATSPNRPSRHVDQENRPMSAMEREYQRDKELIRDIQTKQAYKGLRDSGLSEEEAERLAPAFQRTFGD